MNPPSVVARLGRQAKHCEDLGAPLTGSLIRTLASDYAAGGPCRDLLYPWREDSAASAMLGLRVAGGLHYLVLRGSEPELGSFYPTAGGQFSAEGFTEIALRVIGEKRDFLAEFLRAPPQTNEIGRAGTLLGGFLTIARETGLPLRCLELGASAGLLLQWDRYRYDVGGGACWGAPESPVLIRNRWTHPPTGLPAAISVVQRLGCDLDPVDLGEHDARIRLRSFIWGDHAWRLKRLDAAIAMAQAQPVSIDREGAASWIARQLSEPRKGAATVVYSCFASLYFDQPSNASIGRTLRAAAKAATAEAPLAVMQLEGAGNAPPRLRLQMWPGGPKRAVAMADILGLNTVWLRGPDEGYSPRR